MAMALKGRGPPFRVNMPLPVGQPEAVGLPARTWLRRRLRQVQSVDEASTTTAGRRRRRTRTTIHSTQIHVSVDVDEELGRPSTVRRSTSASTSTKNSDDHPQQADPCQQRRRRRTRTTIHSTQIHVSVDGDEELGRPSTTRRSTSVSRRSRTAPTRARTDRHHAVSSYTDQWRHRQLRHRRTGSGSYRCPTNCAACLTALKHVRTFICDIWHTRDTLLEELPVSK